MADGTDQNAGQPCRRILVVDDDPDLAEALQISLIANGYETEIAHSAAEAIPLLEDFAADMALVDIRLGLSSGIDLISELRKVRADIMSVIITAYASAETAIDALHRGAYDYLCKPFGNNELLAIVERCFRHVDLATQKRKVETALRARNEELERINQRLASAADGMRALACSTTLRELSQRMLETVARNLGAAGGALYILEGEFLILRRSLNCGEADESIPLPLDQDSAIGQAMKTCQPVLESDPVDSTSRLVFPLFGGGDAPIGALELKAKESAPFAAQDREFGLLLVSFSRETYRVVQALERLANSEERFRCLFENTPSAVFLKDLDGRFLLVNRHMEERYGRSTADVVGQTAHDIHPKEHADVLVAQDREALETNTVVEREIKLPFADGTLHSVVVTKFPVLDADGGAIGVGTVSTDVTDRRRMEEQLRQSQKMEALGQLTGGVAHDFNNLLAIIFGNLDLMNEEIDDEDSYSGLVEDALEAARRGADLTRRLLAFGRRQTLLPEVIDIGDLVQGMSSLLERTLGETIEIETISAGKPPKTMVDQGQLEIALLNLAVNARDAMPDGGKLTIESGWADLDPVDDDDPGLRDKARPRRQAMLALHDTGTGMPEHVAAHAFEPFFTTKEVGRGSGLGLSMVYGFVKQSGGHVVLDSRVGSGTTVRIFLPEAMGETAPLRSAEIAASEPPGRGETVLVVEDEPGVRRLATELLRRLGYRVTAAGDARSALAALQGEAKFDLLLTDIVLPGGMSGIQLATEAQSRNSDLKVLLVSGYATSNLAAAMSRDRTPMILNKPFRKADLARAMREVLDHSECNQ